MPPRSVSPQPGLVGCCGGPIEATLKFHNLLADRNQLKMNENCFGTMWWQDVASVQKSSTTPRKKTWKKKDANGQRISTNYEHCLGWFPTFQHWLFIPSCFTKIVFSNPKPPKPNLTKYVLNLPPPFCIMLHSCSIWSNILHIVRFYPIHSHIKMRLWWVHPYKNGSKMLGAVNPNGSMVGEAPHPTPKPHPLPSCSKAGSRCSAAFAFSSAIEALCSRCRQAPSGSWPWLGGWSVNSR